MIKLPAVNTSSKVACEKFSLEIINTNPYDSLPTHNLCFNSVQMLHLKPKKPRAMCGNIIFKACTKTSVCQAMKIQIY